MVIWSRPIPLTAALRMLLRHRCEQVRDLGACGSLTEKGLEAMVRAQRECEPIVAATEADLRAGEHDLELGERIAARLARDRLVEQGPSKPLGIREAALIGVEDREHRCGGRSLLGIRSELCQLDDRAAGEGLCVGESPPRSQDPRAKEPAQDHVLAAF
jgi:hypothetical protein